MWGCAALLQSESCLSHDGDIPKVWNNWPGHGRSWEARTALRAIPEIWTEGVGHSLLPALLPQLLRLEQGFHPMVHLMEKKILCLKPYLSLLFATLSCKGHFKKEHPWNNLDIFWGTKESFIWTGLGDQETDFIFVLIYIKLLSFDPHVQYDTVLQDTLMDLWSWICIWRRRLKFHLIWGIKPHMSPQGMAEFHPWEESLLALSGWNHSMCSMAVKCFDTLRNFL